MDACPSNLNSAAPVENTINRPERDGLMENLKGDSIQLVFFDFTLSFPYRNHQFLCLHVAGKYRRLCWNLLVAP